MTACPRSPRPPSPAIEVYRGWSSRGVGTSRPAVVVFYPGSWRLGCDTFIPYLFGGLAITDGAAPPRGHASSGAGCHSLGLGLASRYAAACLGTLAQWSGDVSSPAPMGSVDR